MIRGMGKVTSLLVAAATVASLVPFSGVNAAEVKRISSDDGTIYNAIAYKDGKAYIDGEINDNEEAYYLANGKFNKLEDVDSGDDAVLFGEKYLDISDGDYTVDLDKGTVTDDDIKGDTEDDAAAALRKKIKDDTDDRYNETEANTIKDSNHGDLFDLIPGAKYNKVWYYTQYKAAQKSIDKNVNGLNGLDAAHQMFNVFTDEKGNYIDADYNLGKVKVTTTASSASGTTLTKTDTIENTNDAYDAADGIINGTNISGSDKLSASVVQDRVLAQDKDYIYRLATVKVTITTGAAATISEINGVKVDPNNSNDIFKVENNGQVVSFKAIQKISKTQASGDVDDAKYAKTVTTYALSDKDGKKLDAEELFINTSGNIVTTTNYTVAGGKLIAYNSEINNNDKVTVRAYTLKSSSGFYYADEEDQSKEDCENSKNQGAAVQTDVDGNLWRLDGGYIYKFDNTDDWDKVYRVDGSFDEFSVYDKDNIVAWSQDDDVYSVIGGKQSNSDPDDTPVVKTGWVQATDGTWTYNKEDGTKATGWLNLNGTWYYLKTDGVMATGWLNLNGTWYYLNSSGAMATGWLNLNGTWYYLNQSGAMATGWANVNGTWYFLNGSGAMQTGWLNDNGTWYYLYSNGAMAANTVINGYRLSASGAWV
ncbi:N-acetylmuramoyl-L-alanine amidase family protein [Clostridium beijerinckii]|uniref:Glucan-binding YG repeat protein n=2 Tax=Clostridium beijerinckii TaxID=1520 RepID=A0A9Q5CGR4_CLOBE|nr:N-acetylmuramoyl-L-alanine amidase family protein [Clostridium beijerinckii]AQS07579.1 autolysin [Clostridium beijerinckii]MBA2908941.1 glucan-binding YG repeat protein [Clostridium beijerinckii]MBA9012784.1 glucan-binding YG repeat protein [Clostridium beijerinckii]MBC2416669.1 N-acetylmuramoyl-L-alanine amidase family protein [Clostridium beijerinckii]MBC2422960.1 N-acetylmuramoyl-L-alanine amidase family protein [Clostridium beijerinckii]